MGTPVCWNGLFRAAGQAAVGWAWEVWGCQGLGKGCVERAEGQHKFSLLDTVVRSQCEKEPGVHLIPLPFSHQQSPFGGLLQVATEAAHKYPVRGRPPEAAHAPAVLLTLFFF